MTQVNKKNVQNNNQNNLKDYNFYCVLDVKFYL